MSLLDIEERGRSMHGVHAERLVIGFGQLELVNRIQDFGALLPLGTAVYIVLFYMLARARTLWAQYT